MDESEARATNSVLSFQSLPQDLLWASGMDGKIHVVDVDTGALLRLFPVEATSRIHAMAPLDTSSILLGTTRRREGGEGVSGVGDVDHPLRLISPRTQQGLPIRFAMDASFGWQRQHHLGSVFSLYNIAYHNLLCSSSHDCTVKLWKTRKNDGVWNLSCIETLRVPRIEPKGYHCANRVLCFPNCRGNHLFASSRDGGIFAWDLCRPLASTRLRSHHPVGIGKHDTDGHDINGLISLLCVVDEYDLVASCSHDGELKLWSVKNVSRNWKAVRTVRGRRHRGDLCWWPDQRLLLSSGPVFELWDLRKMSAPMILRVLRKDRCRSLLASGSRVFVGSQHGVVTRIESDGQGSFVHGFGSCAACVIPNVRVTQLFHLGIAHDAAISVACPFESLHVSARARPMLEVGPESGFAELPSDVRCLLDGYVRDDDAQSRGSLIGALGSIRNDEEKLRNALVILSFLSRQSEEDGSNSHEPALLEVKRFVFSVAKRIRERDLLGVRKVVCRCLHWLLTADRAVRSLIIQNFPGFVSQDEYRVFCANRYSDLIRIWEDYYDDLLCRREVEDCLRTLFQDRERTFRDETQRRVLAEEFVLGSRWISSRSHARELQDLVFPDGLVFCRVDGLETIRQLIFFSDDRVDSWEELATVWSSLIFQETLPDVARMLEDRISRLARRTACCDRLAEILVQCCGGRCQPLKLAASHGPVSLFNSILQIDCDCEKGGMVDICLLTCAPDPQCPEEQLPSLIKLAVGSNQFEIVAKLLSLPEICLGWDENTNGVLCQACASGFPETVGVLLQDDRIVVETLEGCAGHTKTPFCLCLSLCFSRARVLLGIAAHNCHHQVVSRFLRHQKGGNPRKIFCRILRYLLVDLERHPEKKLQKSCSHTLSMFMTEKSCVCPALPEELRSLMRFPRFSARVDVDLVVRMHQCVEEGRCTFTATESTYVAQKWFNCRTCGLIGATGCCEGCLRTCHAGHDVAESSSSPNFFYCDCWSFHQRQDVLRVNQ